MRPGCSLPAGDATPAAAQEDLDCENAMAQAELNMCADQITGRPTRTGKSGRKRADGEGARADQSSDDMKAEAALPAAQRLDHYRDRNCELAGFEARGARWSRCW